MPPVANGPIGPTPLRAGNQGEGRQGEEGANRVAARRQTARGTGVHRGRRWCARGGGASPAGVPARSGTGPKATDPMRRRPKAADRARYPDRRVRARAVGPHRRSPAGGTDKPRPPAHRAVQAPAELPPDIANELASAAGPDWNILRDRITERMAAGIGAYERERYRDASRILKTVVDAVPTRPVGP